MRDVCGLIWLVLIGLFRSRASLQVEILTLRHQLNVLRRKAPQRLTFSSIDRLVFAGLCGLAPGVLDALKIVKPETVIRWHRAGFRVYWRWKSRPRGGRPKTPLEIRRLIREMSLANPLWGAPRIHGELLKLGIDVGQTTVAKYMARGRQPPSQGWKTFLHNHADGHRVDGPIRGSNNLIPAALRAADTASRSPPNPVAGSDRVPNSRMDFAPAHRGLWLESSAAIHHS
jgi:hypothetical protein